MGGNPVDKGRMMWLGKTSGPLTFVHTSDLAAYLAVAVDADADADAEDAERIDIGWDRPVSVWQTLWQSAPGSRPDDPVLRGPCPRPIARLTRP